MSDRDRLKGQILGPLVKVAELNLQYLSEQERAFEVGNILNPLPDDIPDMAQYYGMHSMTETELQNSIHIEDTVKEVKADIDLLIKANNTKEAQNILRDEAGEIARIQPKDRQAWIEKQIQAYRDGDKKGKQELLNQLSEEMAKTTLAVKKAKETVLGDWDDEKEREKRLSGLIDDISKTQAAVKKMAAKVAVSKSVEKVDECDTCGVTLPSETGGELMPCNCGIKYCSKGCKTMRGRVIGHWEICKMSNKNAIE